MLPIKKILLFVFLGMILSGSAYAQVCDVSNVKDVLKKNLYLYLANSTTHLTLDQMRDLLGFYLGIGSGTATVDCSSVGASSSTQISTIVSTGETATNVIPSCEDGTTWGECSMSKPKFCYSGSLFHRCNECGCPAGHACGGDGICTSTGQNIECSTDLDCGADEFTGSHYCTNVSVNRDFVNYTCTNPGLVNATCTSTTESIVLDICDENQNKTCVEGMSTCDTFIPVYNCSDTDGGNEASVLGTVTGIELNTPFDDSDHCLTSRYLFEYYCFNNYQATAVHDCQLIATNCSGGICV